MQIWGWRRCGPGFEPAGLCRWLPYVLMRSLVYSRHLTFDFSVWPRRCIAGRQSLMSSLKRRRRRSKRAFKKATVSSAFSCALFARPRFRPSSLTL